MQLERVVMAGMWGPRMGRQFAYREVVAAPL